MHIRLEISQFGTPEEVLEPKQVPTVMPGYGNVLVALHAASVNPSDLLTIGGVYSVRTSLPFTPGFEGVGTVVALGDGVHSLKVGDIVLPLRGEGTWQEYVMSPESHCVRVPERWSAIEAAQLYVNPLSAWLMLRQTLPEPQGQWIALNAANSALGRVLIQFAAHLGAHTIGIVRGQCQFSALTELGATRLVDAERESICTSVMFHTAGLGVKAAFDAIGGSAAAELVATLSTEGVMVHYGLLSGEPLPREVSARHFWLRIGLIRLIPGAGKTHSRNYSRTSRGGTFVCPMYGRIQSRECAKPLALPNSGGGTTKFFW